MKITREIIIPTISPKIDYINGDVSSIEKMSEIEIQDYAELIKQSVLSMYAERYKYSGREKVFGELKCECFRESILSLNRCDEMCDVCLGKIK